MVMPRPGCKRVYTDEKDSNGCPKHPCGKEECKETPITPSTDCKQITADGKTYYGTVASGFTSEQVVAGADKLLSLFGMVGSFLGPDMAKQVNDCKDDYKADIIRQLLPRCDDKCEPMKQCKSSCKALKSKCVPSSLQGYFPMVKKGGSLRSMLPMIGLSEGAPELKVIDAWLEKLNKCDSEYVTNAKVCLSADYAGAACNPSVTPTPTPIDLHSHTEVNLSCNRSASAAPAMPCDPQNTVSYTHLTLPTKA